MRGVHASVLACERARATPTCVCGCGTHPCESAEDGQFDLEHSEAHRFDRLVHRVRACNTRVVGHFVFDLG